MPPLYAFHLNEALLRRRIVYLYYYNDVIALDIRLERERLEEQQKIKSEISILKARLNVTYRP